MNQTKEKYLIALDMDGTLLNKDHIISLETLNYLKKLNKDGHKIIISSGCNNIKQIAENLSVDYIPKRVAVTDINLYKAKLLPYLK